MEVVARVKVTVKVWVFEKKWSLCSLPTISDVVDQWILILETHTNKRMYIHTYVHTQNVNWDLSLQKISKKRVSNPFIYKQRFAKKKDTYHITKLLSSKLNALYLNHTNMSMKMYENKLLSSCLGIYSWLKKLVRLLLFTCLCRLFRYIFACTMGVCLFFLWVTHVR